MSLLEEDCRYSVEGICNATTLKGESLDGVLCPAYFVNTQGAHLCRFAETVPRRRREQDVDLMFFGQAFNP